MTDILLLLVAYLLGSIPSGLIVGKLFYKTDIREHGSGNLGGTNTFRTLGVKAGLIVSIADILKGTLATALATWFGSDFHPLLIGLFAVVGHIYPLFAGFRGGKAVATSGGVLLAYNPVLFLLLFLSFLLSLYITKMVSLSSMIAAVAALTYSIFTRDLPLILVVIAFTTFVFYRHRANIKRIMNKTEPKITWMSRQKD